MQVEADLQLSRLLAGLHGTDARREISEIASNVMEAGVQMTLLDDRLIAMMEAAQVNHSPQWSSTDICCSSLLLLFFLLGVTSCNRPM